MKKRIGTYAVLALAATALTVAFGAGYSTSDRPSATAQYVIPPKSKIINLPSFLQPASQADEPVGLLDTVTGAIYRLHGNLDVPSVRQTWTQRVPPVDGPTSGLLDVQVIRFNDIPERSFVKDSQVFLVDQVTGRTWWLRQTASTNGMWSEVKIFR